MIRAVIFDMDGVLIESEETWSRVRGAVVARYGGHWTEQDQRNVMGDNSRQWSSYIKRTWNVPLSEEEIFRDVLQSMIAIYERELALIPGAREAVERMAGRYPLALASSSPRELIGVVLRLSGLDRYFHATVSSDEVVHGKPAPDVYLLAAERLGAPPAECAAVEDSTNGIRAAIAAGMTTIAIPNRAYMPPDDVLASAHAVLQDIGELTLTLLEQIIP